MKKKIKHIICNPTPPSKDALIMACRSILESFTPKEVADKLNGEEFYAIVYTSAYYTTEETKNKKDKGKRK
jgi:hypothetical protein